MRGIIFEGTQYIGSELLWSVLKYASDREAIRKSLESQLSSKADNEVRQSFLKLSCTVGTKLHIIKHILEQLENSSLAQSDSTGIKENIRHCFNEISFSMAWLDELREGCAAARNIKVGE